MVLNGELADVFWSGLQIAVPACGTYLVVRLLVAARRATGLATGSS
jgi:flagellar biosynthesis protein FliR